MVFNPTIVRRVIEALAQVSSLNLSIKELTDGKVDIIDELSFKNKVAKKFIYGTVTAAGIALTVDDLSGNVMLQKVGDTMQTQLTNLDNKMKGKVGETPAVQKITTVTPALGEAPVPVPVATPEPVLVATPEPVPVATPEPVPVATPEPVVEKQVIVPVIEQLLVLTTEEQVIANIRKMLLA